MKWLLLLLSGCLYTSVEGDPVDPAPGVEYLCTISHDGMVDVVSRCDLPGRSQEVTDALVEKLNGRWNAAIECTPTTELCVVDECVPDVARDCATPPVP